MQVDWTAILGAFIASLLGGSISVSLIEWYRTSQAERKRRQIDFLDKQIRELYGPLYFLTSQSERMFQLYGKIHNAYRAEYIKPQFSNDERTKRVLEQETSTTLDIGNKYLQTVLDNNDRMYEILSGHSSLMDPQDVEVFLTFLEHRTRHQTEIDSANGGLAIPMRVYQHLGDISFLRPEVIECIKNQFHDKKSHLQRLSGL